MKKVDRGRAGLEFRAACGDARNGSRMDAGREPARPFRFGDRLRRPLRPA